MYICSPKWNGLEDWQEWQDKWVLRKSMVWDWKKYKGKKHGNMKVKYQKLNFQIQTKMILLPKQTCM